MTVVQFKKLLRCIDRDMDIVFKVGEEFYTFDSIYKDQLENNLVCKLELL